MTLVLPERCPTEIEFVDANAAISRRCSRHASDARSHLGSDGRPV